MRLAAILTVVCTGVTLCLTGLPTASLAGSADGLYMVVNLSGGTDATNYPVTYLDDVPPGGWKDADKTEKLVLRRIPATAGFTMGSPSDEFGREADEIPHTVILTRGFYIGVFEVTQRQWELVMGNRPSYFTNETYYATRPVEGVPYYAIRENLENRAIYPHWPESDQVHADSFMGKLRAKTGQAFDLPTESQWEYACRAGTATALNSGKNVTSAGICTNMAEVGRYYYNGGEAFFTHATYDFNVDTSEATAKAGSYLPNAWGLYDMHGNVWEWCLDWPSVYPGTVQDPPGAVTGVVRIVRGGGWSGSGAGMGCRSANRSAYAPDVWGASLGFRAASALYAEDIGFGPQVGVAFGMTIPEVLTNVSKVTVKGLPAGLKFNTATKTIEGVPTKAGTNTVVFSAQGGPSLTMTLMVAALPAWAQGLFNGYVDGGIASMTVSAQGKITGKLSKAGTNYTFSAASYAAGGDPTNGFSIATSAKAGKTALPLTLRVKRAGSSQTLGIVSSPLGSVLPLLLYRNMWSTEVSALSPFIGYYTATLPGNGEYGSGYLALTVDKAGKAKVAGKLADGTAVSQSGILILDATGGVFTVVYTAPATYKGGCLFGLARFVNKAVGTVYLQPMDGSPFLWQSLNPQATQTYAGGFARELDIAGGWYSKSENLNTYYAGMNLTVGTDTNAPSPELAVGSVRYDSVFWDPMGVVLTPALKSGVMTGLVAPVAGKPTDADKNGEWDYSATNSVGLKISLTRATGIFKGSFNAWFDYPEKKHVSKSLPFEGALTPVRENMDDGVAGRGFFLWADKSVTPAYAFKWSYDCKILMANAEP